MTIVFTTETIRLLTLFENITNVSVRDCFVNGDTVYFIVEEGKIGLAIGKNGSLIKNAERVIKRNIKVYEHSSDPEKFINNLIPYCKAIEIIKDDGNLTAEIKVERKDRGRVIGREGERIKIYREILKRAHNISNLKVK